MTTRIDGAAEVALGVARGDSYSVEIKIHGVDWSHDVFTAELREYAEAPGSALASFAAGTPTFADDVTTVTLTLPNAETDGSDLPNPVEAGGPVHLFYDIKRTRSGLRSTLLFGRFTVHGSVTQAGLTGGTGSQLDQAVVELDVSGGRVVLRTTNITDTLESVTSEGNAAVAAIETTKTAAIAEVNQAGTDAQTAIAADVQSASDDADAAQGSQLAAATARDKSQEWAESTGQEPGGTGTKSSKEWATEAGQSATNAANSEVAAQTAANGALGGITDALTNENLWPDPFLRESTLAGGFTGIPSESTFAFAGAWTSLGKEAGQTYPLGNVLRRPNSNVTMPEINVYLDKLGLQAGDTFYLSLEARHAATGTTAAGVFVRGKWWPRAGAQIGSNVDLVTLTAPAPLTENLSQFTTAQLTIPAGAGRLELEFPAWGVPQPYLIESIQITLDAPLDKPNQAPLPPDFDNRVSNLIDHDPVAKNNAVFKRSTEYSALTIGRTLGGIAASAAFGGYGQSLTASACPTGGFNAIQDSWQWSVAGNEPVELLAVVTTCATGDYPLDDGVIVAWGSIGVDPLSGNAGTEPIQLFDLDGNPKTVMPADLSDLMGISFVGIKEDGNIAANIFVSRQNSDFTYADPAEQGYRIAGTANGVGLGAQFSSISVSFMWGPKLVTLTDPVLRYRKPSAQLAGALATRIDEPPALIALPPKVWCIVGERYKLQFDNIQQREAKRTDYFTSMASMPANSGPTPDGFDFLPTAAGDRTLALQASSNNAVQDSGTTVFSTVATTAGAGTVRGLGLGTSITNGGGTQARLTALATADGTTSLVNLGTQGSSPNNNEGYSGQPSGIFQTSGNPFENGGSFDFSNYVSTNITGGDPTHVYFEIFWDLVYALSDAAAASAALGTVGRIESYVADIKAHSASINCALCLPFLPPRDGIDGQRAALTAVNQTDRHRRNLMIGAQTFIDQLSSSSDIDLIPVGPMTNSATAYPRGKLIPNDPALYAKVEADGNTYANHAAMVADLTPSDGEFCYVTDGGTYYVKVGGASGYWRTVTESDGFRRVYSDTVHPTLGHNTAGDQLWAWMKATL